jgi:hypothetical protein
MCDKENKKADELEVKIEKSIFESKFKGDLDVLISKLRFNASSQLFYIV